MNVVWLNTFENGIEKNSVKIINKKTKQGTLYAKINSKFYVVCVCSVYLCMYVYVYLRCSISWQIDVFI